MIEGGVMKNLKSLFNCNIDVQINDVQINSKYVKKNDLFICYKGINSDGHHFIKEAIDNGAAAVVCDRTVHFDIPTLYVDDVNSKTPEILDWFYGKPNDKIKNIIGVTGTSGKTSTCTIINQLLNKLNQNSSISIGTSGILLSNNKLNILKTPNTTFPINDYYKIVNDYSNKNIDNLVLEASSSGLKQKRFGSTMFDIAIVTNLSFAHLNEHTSMNDYIHSKLLMIDLIRKNGYLIMNSDEKNLEIFKNRKDINKISFGFDNKSDLHIKNVYFNDNNTSFEFAYHNVEYVAKTNLLGLNHIYNICAALITCDLLGFSIQKCITFLENLYISGRMELYKNVILDFAVTIKSLKSNLIFLNKTKKNRIISVISKVEGKHPLEYKQFGFISTLMSDHVIFTTNRNKTNDSQAIKTMLLGCQKDNYEIILDREEAIKKAMKMREENDIVYIVGSEYFYRRSGEECVNPYQIIDEYENHTKYL